MVKNTSLLSFAFFGVRSRHSTRRRDVVRHHQRPYGGPLPLMCRGGPLRACADSWASLCYFSGFVASSIRLIIDIYGHIHKQTRCNKVVGTAWNYVERIRIRSALFT